MNLSLARFLIARPPGASSPIVRRLASGGFWSLAGEAGSRSLAFAGAIVVARWLGVAEFGAFALIQSTLAMLMTFALFGMGLTSTRYIAAFRNTEPARIEGIASLALYFSVLTGLAAAILLFAAAPYVATDLFRAPELETPLRLMAPVLLLYAVSGAMSGTILGFEAFRRLAHLAWASSLANFIAVVVGVSFWGLRGALIGLVGSELFRCILTMWLAGTVMRENGFALFGRANLSEAKILWRFSLPLLLGSALHTPIMWLCQTMIARQPGGMAEIGMYDAALKFMTLVMLVPMAASAAFMPVLANLNGDGNRSTFKRTTNSLALVQLVLTAIPAAIVALAGPWAIQIFGSSFAAASPVVVFMMALAPIFVLKHLYWQALTSGGHAWASLWLSVLWAVVAVSLTSIWQDGGAASLVKAMLVAYGVTLAASVVLVEWIWRR